MATKLDKPLRRAIDIRGRPFVVTISPDGLKLVGKGRRKGLELTWEDLSDGDAALATALNASLKATLEPTRGATEVKGTRRRSNRPRSPGRR